ncbi:type IV secretion system protein [Telmatospirillum sp.]|uniref:type IV secretion system protein n=1 Tax=Telmatospirillum sp. TaxID=2079197 RepID=UPI00284C1B57|nr:type IV secretion system protein [Telmatospirillum sp.]MDR3439225.1 type IV secretion system protein [Telmatospirillum sp.]
MSGWWRWPVLFVVGGMVLLRACRPATALSVQDLHDQLTGGCWACDTLEQVGGIGQDIAQQLFGNVADGLSSLLGLLVGIWLLWQAGRMLLPFGPASASARFGNQIARKLLGFAVVLAVLQNGQAVWDFVFTPILSIGTGFASLLLSQELSSACPVVSPAGAVQDTKIALAGMRCSLSAIQDLFTRGVLTGAALVSGASWHSWLDLLKFWSWQGRLLQLISGVLLALVYAFGFLLFPVFFIDAILRVAIIAVLAPVMVAAGLLSSVRHIAQKALWGLARSSLTMVFAAIAAGIATATLTHIFGGLVTSDGTPIVDGAALIAGLQAGTIKLTIADRAYWAILAGGILAIFMVRGAASMAGDLVGEPAGESGGATSAAAALAGVATWLGGKLVYRVSRHAAVWSAKITSDASHRTRSALPAGDGATLAAKVSGRAKI